MRRSWITRTTSISTRPYQRTLDNQMYYRPTWLQLMAKPEDLMIRFHLIKLYATNWKPYSWGRAKNSTSTLLTLIVVLIENRSVERLFQALLVAFREEQHGLGGTFRRLQQALKKPVWLTVALGASRASPVDWDSLLSSTAAIDTSSPCPKSGLRESTADDRALNHDGTCTSRALLVQWEAKCFRRLESIIQRREPSQRCEKPAKHCKFISLNY